MNKTHRIQPRVLIENIEKLDEMANNKGLSRQEFMGKIAGERFVFPDEDTQLLFKIAGLKSPFKKENIKTMKSIEVTNWNTKRYSVEVTPEIERGLLMKAHSKACTGRNAIADLLNKVCINGVMFISQELIDYFMLKNGDNTVNIKIKQEGGKK